VKQKENYPNRESNSGLSHNSIEPYLCCSGIYIRTTIEQAFSLWSGNRREEGGQQGLTTLTTASLFSPLAANQECVHCDLNEPGMTISLEKCARNLAQF
jgi:hypothetical protein